MPCAIVRAVVKSYCDKNASEACAVAARVWVLAGVCVIKPDTAPSYGTASPTRDFGKQAPFRWLNVKPAQSVKRRQVAWHCSSVVLNTGVMSPPGRSVFAWSVAKRSAMGLSCALATTGKMPSAKLSETQADWHSCRQ